jgi:hypothetical protein
MPSAIAASTSLARIVDPRETGIRDERVRLSGGDAREQLDDPSCLVVAMDADEASRANLVAIEEDLRAAGVLAEYGVRVAERGQHAERDIREVADRCRTDDERH